MSREDDGTGPAFAQVSGAALAAATSEDVIDRLYDVAVDPMRYEQLLDRWEEMIGPQRGRAANLSNAPDLRQFEGHFERADRLLDRAFTGSAAPELSNPAALLARIDRAAAFAVDRSLTVIEVNVAAASVFGITKGARAADLALGPGEAEVMVGRIARLFGANDREGTVLRSRSARADRLVLMQLRLVRPEDGAAPFVLAVSSEFVWPEGFSALLRQAFDLTPAEVEVIKGLSEGQALQDIARTRERSIETVRAQLKAIMSKTETRSQSELVRLTLSTMELVQTSQADAEGRGGTPPGVSTGFSSLEERPFRTLVLPDRRRLDYLILGDPEGRPVLFFPLDYGLVRWPASAESEAARLGLKIIVPVRPGYGRSTPLPRSAPYMAHVVDDLARLLDHLGTGPVPLLTLGNDSFIAIAFHAAFPEKVKALVACAGVLPLTRPEQYERMDKWHRFILAGARYTPHLLPFMVKAGFALARRLGKRGFVHAVYGNSAADVATFEIPEVFEAMVCGSEVALSETHSAHGSFSREVIHNETHDWSAEMAALAGSGLPVHFLNGLQDPQVPPGTLQDFRADYPWIDFRVYPDAGQLLFFLKWRDALPLVMRYL